MITMRLTQITNNKLSHLQKFPLTQKTVQTEQTGKVKFSDMVEDYVSEVNSLQDEADQALNDIATGKTDNVHRFAIKVSEADLSFRLMVEIRNKLVDAYNEIMKMSV